MDNLEYFNGIVSPTMLVDGKESTIESKDVEEKDGEDGGNTKMEPQNANRLPMPPSTTNLKTISAAALVASRRKVIPS